MTTVDEPRVVEDSTGRTCSNRESRGLKLYSNLEQCLRKRILDVEQFFVYILCITVLRDIGLSMASFCGYAYICFLSTYLIHSHYKPMRR